MAYEEANAINLHISLKTDRQPHDSFTFRLKTFWQDSEGIFASL